MRKILLTTTALVGLGGISAASALDISGSYEFTYSNSDDGVVDTGGNNTTSFGNDARVQFSGSQTSDAGLTFSGLYAINHSAAVEDMGLTDDVPHARLSESKIKKIIIQSILRYLK